MQNVLDLTDEDLDEDKLLFKLKQAFDNGDDITEIKINSQTAISLHSSPSIGFHDVSDALLYHSPFGVIAVTPVSRHDLTQTEMAL